jgi:hypothetical protein
LICFWDFNEREGITVAFDRHTDDDGVFMKTARRTKGIVGRGAASFDNKSGAEVVTPQHFSADIGFSIGAVFISRWSGKESDTDMIFYRGVVDNHVFLCLRKGGNSTSRSVAADPVLTFCIHVDGMNRELDLPLDGADGRPTLEQIRDGKPHHVVATYDNDTGEQAIYLDGKKRSGVRLGAGKKAEAGRLAEAHIGNGPRGDEPFNGVIDELGLWNCALSADEIAAHYANCLAGHSYFFSARGDD